MRQLAPAQRKITEHLCRATRPVAVKQIAEACLMSQQTTAKQISELAKLGLINRIQSGRNTYCELAEPLLRICIEVKDNRTEYLRLFVEFLRHWFSSKELTSRLDGLDRHGPHGRWVDRVHLQAAISECSRDGREPLLDALAEEGRRCLETEDWDGLYEIGSRLAHERPEPRNHVLCVYALRRCGKHRLAPKAAESALKQHPDDRLLLYEFAHALADEDRSEESLSVMDRALRIHPDDPTFLCARSRVLLRMGRYADVIEAQDALAQADPHHTHSNLARGAALAGLGRWEQAVEWVRTALKMKHATPALWDRLAYELYRARRYPEALIAVEQALGTGAESCELYIHRGDVLRELGQLPDALAAYERATQLDPASTEAHCRKASCLVTLGDHESAIAACDELLRLDTEHLHALLDKARSLIALSRTDDAAEALAGVYRNSNFASELVAASGLFRSIKRPADAHRVVEKAAQLHPCDEWVANEKCRVLIELGQFDKADAELSRLSRVVPCEPERVLISAIIQTGRVGLTRLVRRSASPRQSKRVPYPTIRAPKLLHRCLPSSCETLDQFLWPAA